MDHDTMVKPLVAYLVQNNHTNIFCDLKNYTPPGKITWKSNGDGHIPDVTSVSGSILYVFEVETSDTISTDHTLSQLQLFSAFATEHKRVLVVVVPKNNVADMQDVLTMNSIQAKIWPFG